MVPRLQNSIPRTLWPVYRPPFSETLRHRQLSSQFVATSVFARRGCLLPILATRCETIPQTVCDRERHVPTTQQSTPTQLRVKPATSITTSASLAAHISSTVNAATATTTPEMYTTMTTAVNMTTDTTYRNVNTRTSTTTDATTNLSGAHNAKPEEDEIEGEKARGERTRGNRGGERAEGTRRVSTMVQNDDDERSYHPGDTPRTMDANPIPTARANVIPVAIDAFATRTFCNTSALHSGDQDPTSVRTTRDLSSLSSGARNPWGSLQRRHRRFQPHVTCKAPCPRPPVTETRVLESVRHPYGIGLAKPVFRVPIRTHIVTRSDTSSSQCIIPTHRTSTLISDTNSLHNTSPTVISNIIAYALSLPSHLFSFFGDRDEGVAMFGGGTCVRGLRL
jgi:hypothetical protein